MHGDIDERIFSGPFKPVRVRHAGQVSARLIKYYLVLYSRQ